MTPLGCRRIPPDGGDAYVIKAGGSIPTGAAHRSLEKQLFHPNPGFLPPLGEGNREAEEGGFAGSR
jgi:hypothetical protein